jgi:hypothetical protein
MSVEIHDKLIALLSEVDSFKTKEGELKAEKQRHEEQIAVSEAKCAAVMGSWATFARTNSDSAERWMILKRIFSGATMRRKSSWKTTLTLQLTAACLPQNQNGSELGKIARKPFALFR